MPDPLAVRTASPRALRVCALYPDLMNIYADRGNLLVLERRCEWRGIGFELHSSGLGESFDPDAHDLFYLGGSQDRDQRLCADDLLETNREGLHAAAARGAIVLGVCGGYQLLGNSYTLGDERIAGVELLDVDTVREDRPRQRPKHDEAHKKNEEQLPSAEHAAGWREEEVEHLFHRKRPKDIPSPGKVSVASLHNVDSERECRKQRPAEAASFR